jgi:hypothetical protein
MPARSSRISPYPADAHHHIHESARWHREHQEQRDLIHHRGARERRGPQLAFWHELCLTVGRG